MSDVASTSASATGKAQRMPDPSEMFDGLLLDDSETYFEVPSSHFLARPGGSTDAAARHSASAASTSAHQLQSTENETSSSASYATATQGNGLARSDAKSASSFSFDALQSSLRDVGDIRQLGGLDADTEATPAAVFGGHQARPHMPDTSTLAAADFDVDVRSGFLPPEEPVQRLQGIEEELWEKALDGAQHLPLRIGGGGPNVTLKERKRAYEWRRSIRKMLVLHPSPQIATDIRFARRAHLVLSFLAHFYIHSQPAANSRMAVAVASAYGGGEPEDARDALDEASGRFNAVVPAAIAVPWVAISNLIDIPPVLTYATCVLWNWHLHDAANGFTDENMRMTTTFSNTPSERHFYLMSLLIEKHGVNALTLMRRTLDEAFVGDTLAIRRIRSYLRKLARVIGDLQALLRDVRKNCDPKIFYWGIRPWFNAGDSSVDKVTGEKGWIFEGVEEYGDRRMLFMGPSAGQSSLIHAIDVFLGVDHSGRTSTASSSQQLNATFMERMQTYMPGPHRQFLNHLRSISFVDEEQEARFYAAHGPDRSDDGEHGSSAEEEAESEEERQAVFEVHPIRALLQPNESQQHDGSADSRTHRRAVERLRDAYNVTLTALKHLRDEHMRIATLYIISQMRLAPPPEFAVLDEALVVTDSAGGAKGTGGTDLVSFLKACRTNTINTIFAQSSRED